MELHAKDISKVFKIVAPVFAVAMAILKWTGVFPNITISEIIYISCFIYAAGAGTIDLNLMLDKFTSRKEV
jgi:hypothetical protein